MSDGRRRILAAWLGSVGLHAALLLVTWDSDLLRPAELAGAQAAEDPLELVLTPDSEADRVLPTTYTDVPESHAVETPPEDPQYLAMVHSLAADPLPGGEADSPPGAPEAGEIEQVAIRREATAESGGLTWAGRQIETETAGREAFAAAERGLPGSVPADRQQPPDADDFPLARAEPGPEQGGGEPERRQRAERLPELVGGAPSILRPGPAEAAGDRGFDFDQPAIGRDGNALLHTPDFRLSTWEWDWAPWMKAFGNELRRHWFAPYAYALGVIDGRTVLRLVVMPDGSVTELEVQKEEGHESLHRASLGAIRAAAPFAPLPPSFPQPQLEIVLTLHYPAWKSEPAHAESGDTERGRGREGRRTGR